MQKDITFLENELWYGGAVAYGIKYPISKEDFFQLDLQMNRTWNQFNPVFLSNKGRYIWVEKGRQIVFNQGVIQLDASDYELVLAGTTLKEAVLSATEKHYKPTGTTPNPLAFRVPQYCSWVVLLWSQDQQGILDYARSIIANGYKPGLLIIDDTWQQDYGVWEFAKERFPNPKKMMEELKSLGFSVSMWICPYISPDTPSRIGKKNGIFDHLEADTLIMDGDIPRFARWWEGFSAGLDFTKPQAKKWLNEQTQRLQNEYGVVGFKLDGSDPPYWGEDYADGNLQSTLWVDSIDNSLKEARACYRLAGQPIIQRLNDKAHRWDSDPDELILGLSSLLPSIMAQGLIGYYYGCPDMVGGGMSRDFVDKSGLDDELIIRWCQASALLPMIQFSLDVWNRKQNRVAEYCKKALDLREGLTAYLVEMLEYASKTGIPAVRYLEFDYPNQDLAFVKDEFMLGDKYLVAPVLEKGALMRKVVFPEGKWKDIYDGKEYAEGVYDVDAPIDKLPVFEKIK